MHVSCHENFNPSSDVSFYSSHRKPDTSTVFELFHREHFSFARVFGLISERQKFRFTSFWVFQSQDSVVRMISSFHCDSKGEKFCGFKHDTITSGRLNIWQKENANIISLCLELAVLF